MVAHLWLIHLKQVLKQFAQADNTLRVTRYGVEVAEVLTIKSSENEVAVLLAIGNEAKRSEVCREFLWRNNTIRWESSNDPLSTASANNRSVWLGFHEVKDLPISEKDHDAGFDHVLENEIFVIVTHLEDVGVNNIINSTLPFGCLIIEVGEVVDLFLADFGIKNLLINPSSKSWWDTSLRILYQEWLVVLL